MADSPALILGSASPRRAELLARLGVPFAVHPVVIDELAAIRDDDRPDSAAVRVAEAKFAAIVEELDGAAVAPLLTADTIVACDGVLFAKPADRDDLRRLLTFLSGRDLEISTAVCAARPGEPPRTTVVTTTVGLRRLSVAEIAGYVASGSGDDKAAGLDLQGEAAPFVASMIGCWSNVVGLPLCAVATLLDTHGLGPGVELACAGAACGRR